jgi:hypothetical protein
MSTEKPDYSSPEFEAFRSQWRKVDACLGGTEAMRASAGTNGVSDYLPQWPLENDEKYRQRLATSTFYPAYADTLDGITGTILRKPIRLNDDVSPAIQSDAENIDRAGTHISVFAQRLLTSGIHYGSAYVLVDMPRKTAEVMDRSESAALDFRPFWLLYSASELANWPRYVIINGAPVLQLIVFREQSISFDGFGESSTDRFRVWRLPVIQDELNNFHRAGNAEWEIWEEVETGKDKTELVMIDFGVSPLADIPVAVLNANPCLNDAKRTDGAVLIDLANVNIKLYQQESDHEDNLHLCTPIPYSVNLRSKEEGGVQEQFAWGAGLMFHTDENGGIHYAEPAGTGLAERREWMTGIKQQLLDMGMALAVEGSQKGGQTATETLLRSGTRSSRLTQIATALQDCIEAALAFHAQWKGEEAGGSITLGVKDSDLVLSDQRLATLSAMQKAGQLSLKTLWANMASGGVLPDDFNAETELKELAEEKAAMPQPPVISIQPTEPAITEAQ